MNHAVPAPDRAGGPLSKAQRLHADLQLSREFRGGRSWRSPTSIASMLISRHTLGRQGAVGSVGTRPRAPRFMNTTTSTCHTNLPRARLPRRRADRLLAGWEVSAAARRWSRRRIGRAPASPADRRSPPIGRSSSWSRSSPARGRRGGRGRAEPCRRRIRGPVLSPAPHPRRSRSCSQGPRAWPSRPRS